MGEKDKTTLPAEGRMELGRDIRKGLILLKYHVNQQTSYSMQRYEEIVLKSRQHMINDSLTAESS
jgi:hypothetical protein